MSYPNAIEVCRAELFTKEVELRDRYPQALVDKVLRVREMYNWFISNPDGPDREFVAEVCQRHGILLAAFFSKGETEVIGSYNEFLTTYAMISMHRQLR
ncbi:MAG: hypothetical protein K2L96_04485 [Muribaculaceae bacterium]|nr:hypothetical protein [Muribaculaceae bacterium]